MKRPIKSQTKNQSNIIIDGRWLSMVLGAVFIWVLVEGIVPYTQTVIKNKAEKKDLVYLADQMQGLTVLINDNAEDIRTKLYMIQEDLVVFKTSEHELRRRIDQLEKRQETLIHDSRIFLKSTIDRLLKSTEE